MFKYSLIVMILAMSSVQATPLLLSGEIQSTRYQMVTVPKTARWQVFLQWIAEEGSIVKEGDLVAVFDSGGVEAQLEQNIEQLALKQLELKQTEASETQAVSEAQALVQVAELEVKKAQIEASVPAGQISPYEHDTNQLAYERALLNLVKAREQLTLRTSQRDVAVKKKQLEIVQLEENIAYQQSQLEKLSVRAEITGPVTHALHPWNGKKITAGSNLQASWDVLKIQAQQHYNVVGWIHEADVSKLPQQSNIILTLDAYPGKRFKGRLVNVSSQPELKPLWSDGAYYQLDIDFVDDPEIELSPGMSVRILPEGTLS